MANDAHGEQNAGGDVGQKTQADDGEALSSPQVLNQSIKVDDDKDKNPYSKDIRERLKKIISNINVDGVYHDPSFVVIPDKMNYRISVNVLKRFSNRYLFNINVNYEREISRLISMIGIIDMNYYKNKGKSIVLYNQISCAFTAIESNNIKLFLSIMVELKQNIYGKSKALFVLRGVIGFMFILVEIILMFSLNPNNIINLINSPYGGMILSGISGACGSVVSLFLRIEEFHTSTQKSPFVLTGIILPFTGFIFGFVVTALFQSKIINIIPDYIMNSEGAADSPYIYILIGFISGFSERFAKGLLGRAEDVIGGQGKDSSQKG